ncbi:secreted alkaline phosphatase [Euzebya pacifica]|uniref:Secreted alkaline phosphatase n=1 Tax=Euzebya pacifica TaxID=1608957 RepID=A0A346XTR5_9ACTN|nr:alkaline phosphatase D family protein [Euzebya pacifica]AXV05612.1 secreted alkaline phosphatase [Euzebya pacifica]
MSTTWTRRSFMSAAAAAGVGGLMLPYGVGMLRDEAEAQMQPLGVRFDAFPFPLGVASGDPTADSVILQTRLSDAPFDLDAPWGNIPEDVDVHWVVAEDARLRRIVAQGTVGSSSTRGHAVHVDVTGLEPGKVYWYQFAALGARSRIGRTKTAGIAPLQRLRIAYLSCQSFPHGYFTAYQNLLDEDVDVVFHLGDYMYEYADGGYGDLRSSPPVDQVFSLNSYRVRYAAYRGDPWLRACHARFPFITTWDDHEIDNNWAGETPENTSDEGNATPAAYAERRFNAFQAYHENLPIRPAPEDNAIDAPAYQIYRQFVFGDLLDVSVLDTRQYRTDQPCDDGFVTVNCADQADPDATIMGPTQRDWLFGNLSTSTAAWRVIAQQLIVSQVSSLGLSTLLPDTGAGPAQGGNLYFSADQWDGYLVERQALMSHLADNAIPDTFVITGDIHSSWVLDMKEDFDDPSSATVGTEFVGTSVTSPGFEQLGGNEPFRTGLYASNPHMKYLEGTRKGYTIADITHDGVTVTYRVVDTIEENRSGVSTQSEWLLPRGGAVEQVAGDSVNPLSGA